MRERVHCMSCTDMKQLPQQNIFCASGSLERPYPETSSLQFLFTRAQEIVYYMISGFTNFRNRPMPILCKKQVCLSQTDKPQIPFAYQYTQQSLDR